MYVRLRKNIFIHYVLRMMKINIEILILFLSIFLQLYCPSPKHEFSPRERLMYKPMSSHDIRWNFEKFLINRHGKPVMRFTTSTLPSEMREYITNLLEESH